MKKYIIYISVSIFIILIIPSFIYATDDTEKIKRLKKIHRTTLIYLANRQSTYIKKHFKNYYVASYCSGSFKNAGDYETVVGMVNLKDKIIKYIALVYDKSEKVKSYLIAEFNDDFEPYYDSYNIPKFNYYVFELLKYSSQKEIEKTLFRIMEIAKESWEGNKSYEEFIKMIKRYSYKVKFLGLAKRAIPILRFSWPFLQSIV